MSLMSKSCKGKKAPVVVAQLCIIETNQNSLPLLFENYVCENMAYVFASSLKNARIKMCSK